MIKKDHSRETALAGTFRAFLLAALLLLAALPARASLSFVQAKNNFTAAGTAITVTISTSPNNLLVILTQEGANNTSTVAISDSAGQTWTQTASGYSTGNAGWNVAMWYMPNSAAVTSVTATWSGSLSTNVDAIVFEVSGAATSSVEDTSVNNFQGAGGHTATSGTFGTTNTNDILIFGVRIGGAYTAPTAGAGYTIPTGGDDTNRCAMEYQIVSATQTNATATLTWTTNHSDSNVFGAFKASSGAAPAPGINKRQKLEQLDNLTAVLSGGGLQATPDELGASRCKLPPNGPDA